MSIYLATGVTPGYEKAKRFLETSGGIGNVPITVFGVDYPHFAPFTKDGLNWRHVDYSKLKAQLPKRMLQAGNFTEVAPPHWMDLDTIIFVDADAYFQRPFTDAELELFRSVSLGEMAIGYNMPNHNQTLLEEAPRLSPLKPIPEIARLFPGLEKMACRNFGFVVADFATWKELYRRYLQLHEKIESTFANPARVQFGALYAIQSGLMRIIDLPPAIHSHGHCGIKHGLVKGQDGTWRQDGEVVCFAHAL